jgi:hypothetical protein
MNTMIKHLSLSLTAVVCATGVTAALADKIDASKVTTFAAGAPARAAEVNSTIAELTSAIDDNEQRIAQLLATPAAPPAITLDVDCSADPAALNSAINNASLQTSLEINVSGTCSAVSITRDYVSINGVTAGTTITSNAEKTPVLKISRAKGIKLQNLILDGTDVAEIGLEVSYSSVTEATNLNISGAIDEAVIVILNSTLSLKGENTVIGGSAKSFVAGGFGAILIESGMTTTTSDDCTVQVERNGLFIGEGIFNATGDCLRVLGESLAIIELGTVNTNFATVTGTLYLESQGTDLDVTLNHSGQMLVFSGGTLYLIAKQGGTTTMNASSETASMTVTGNANATFLLTGGGQGSRITTTGNMFIADAYLLASAAGLGFDGRIELGTNGNNLQSEGSRIVLTGNADNNNVPHLGYATVNLNAASQLVLANATTVDTNTSLSVGRNSELNAYALDLTGNGNQVTCQFDGYAFSYFNEVFSDHCAPASAE